VVGIGSGPIDLSSRTVLQVAAHDILGIGDEPAALERTVVMQLRMPRVLFACLAGAALAVSGAALQSLFRNPLADPGIIGVSGGASTGAVAAIVLLPSGLGLLSAWVIPLAAFAAGLGVTALIYVLARPGTGAGTGKLLLVGIAIGSGCSAITGFLTFMADDDELESVVFWQMGSLASVTWTNLAVITPAIILAVVLVTSRAKSLDLLTLGERQAGHLGVDVHRTRRVLVALTALLTAATVAFAGTIGFVGLVVPHIVRLVFGPAHRGVLPLSALTGALLLVVADTLARVLAPPSEVPIGLLTSMLGAPFFLVLVLRSRQVQI
jgi:iron complex transport system permease protein